MPSSATCPRPLEEPPVKVTDDRGESGGGRGRRCRPARGPGLQDDGRPLRRTPHLLPRLVAARSRPTTRSGTPTRGEEERIGQVFCIKGKEQEPVDEVRAGEIGAVAKLVAHGHRRHPRPARSGRSRWPPMRLPGTHAAGGRRARLQGRPGQAEHGPDAPAGGGPDHPRRAQHRDRRAAPVGPGREPDRGRRRAPHAQVRDRHRHPGAARARTARRSADRAKVEGRHKKQTGGRGQFGHVWLEIEPNPGGGVEFATHVVGGVVPRQFFPGVEKGVRDVAEKGPTAGLPGHRLQGHPVRRLVPHRRLRRAVLPTGRPAGHAQGHRRRRSPVLLEPIMEVEVRVPEAYMGEVNRDLNTRRGRVLGMDTDGGEQILRALVPQAELFTYATELRSITGGRGTFSAHLVHVRGGARARRPEGHRRSQGRGGRGRLSLRAPRVAVAARPVSGTGGSIWATMGSWGGHRPCLTWRPACLDHATLPGS